MKQCETTMIKLQQHKLQAQIWNMIAESNMQAGQRDVNALLANLDKKLKGSAQDKSKASKGPKQDAFEHAAEQLQTTAWPGNFVGRVEQQETIRDFITIAMKRGKMAKLLC